MIVNDSHKYLASDCQKIEMKSFLKIVKAQLKIQLLTSILNVNGCPTNITTSSTGYGGERYWFTCPLCKNRCANLYRLPINLAMGCRYCLGLQYGKSTKKLHLDR